MIEFPMLSRAQLEQLLPHRGIAMCLDSVSYTESYPEVIKGTWIPDERYFEGHFGLLPGHWAGESACLAGGVLGMLKFEDLRESIPILADIHVHPVKPIVLGLTLRHDVEIVSREGRLLSFKFQSYRLDNGALCYTGDFQGQAIPKETFKKMMARIK